MLRRLLAFLLLSSAFSFAQMPAIPDTPAGHALAAWLDALPDPTLKPASPDTRAARLIALLPQRKTLNSPPPLARTDAVAPAKPRALTKAMLVAIYLILSLCIQLFIARREAPASPELNHAPASAIVPPQAPPTTSGK